MTKLQFPRLTLATLLALPIVLTTLAAPAQAEVIIRGNNFGIRLGGSSRYPHRYNRVFRHNHQRRSSSVYRAPRSIYGPYGRSGSVYQQPRIIYDRPDIIYRRTEVISPNGRSRIILEDPEYITPNRTIVIPSQRRYYRNRQVPTYAPGQYLIPIQNRINRPFGY